MTYQLEVFGKVEGGKVKAIRYSEQDNLLNIAVITKPIFHLNSTHTARKIMDYIILTLSIEFLKHPLMSAAIDR